MSPRRTPRVAKVASALVAAGLTVLSTAAPSHAEDEVNIDHLESADGAVSLVLAVDGIPGGAEVDPESVMVEVDGRAVDASAKVITAGDVQRTTILVLDASNSMLQGD
jgi:tight adherence protein B